MSDRPPQPFDPGPETALGLLPSIALSSSHVKFNLIDSAYSCNVLYCLSSPKPLSYPSRFELLVSLGKELFFLASKLRMRRHVSNRTVEPDRVVMMDVLFYCLTSIINAGQALGPYAVSFDRPMISLNLPIALRVVRRSFHMGHSCDAYELFEVSGDELGAVIRDDLRSCIEVLFPASLDNRFDIDLLHFLPDCPMNNLARTTVQDAAHARGATQLPLRSSAGSLLQERGSYGPLRHRLSCSAAVSQRLQQRSRLAAFAMYKTVLDGVQARHRDRKRVFCQPNAAKRLQLSLVV